MKVEANCQVTANQIKEARNTQRDALVTIVALPILAAYLLAPPLCISHLLSKGIDPEPIEYVAGFLYWTLINTTALALAS